MPEARLIVHNSVLPRQVVDRFPTLRNSAARRQELIETVYQELGDDVQAFAVPDATAREVLDFYNAVVEDGRWVSALRSDPKTVARLLDRDLSDEAVQAIVETTGRIGSNQLDEAVDVGVTVVTVAVVGVTVTVIILGSAGPHPEEIIIDHAGRVRF